MSHGGTGARECASRAGGFTLLEVLMAMSLFALVGTAVNVLSINAMRQSVYNRHGTTAVRLVQQELETLRGRQYTEIVNNASRATVAGLNYTIGTAVDVDTPAAGMKQITVKVSWTGLEGTKSYEVKTIFTSVTG